MPVVQVWTEQAPRGDPVCVRVELIADGQGGQGEGRGVEGVCGSPYHETARVAELCARAVLTSLTSEGQVCPWVNMSTLLRMNDLAASRRMRVIPLCCQAGLSAE